MGCKSSQLLSLGTRIKRSRENAGFTQDQLAERIGISRTTIARYELGEIEPKLKTLVLIAECLHVSSDYLLDIKSPDTDMLQLSPNAKDALEVLIRELKLLNNNQEERKHKI